MKHLGDFDASTLVYGKFTTYRPSTGATFALGGTPVLSVYKDNSVTQSVSGVTLTVDFDAVTGLNHYAIDTSTDGTFYSAGSFFDIVITTGTVDSVSVTGTVVGSFTIRKNSALKPATAGRTVVVDAAGLIDSNMVKAGPTGSGTAQTAGDIIGDTNDIQTRLPAALVSGRMDASVGAMAAGVLTATAIAADAITDAKVAADVTIASVTGSVGSVTGLTAANLDVAVSTRMATFAQPTGFLAATFPGTVASPTNITAGTITTVTNLTNAATAGDLTATMKASVNAEVLDTLATDTYSEPGSGGAVPGVAITLSEKIGWLYKAWRNKVTQSSTEYRLYDDNGSVSQIATVSDDATTFTRNEVAGST